MSATPLNSFKKLRMRAKIFFLRVSLVLLRIRFGIYPFTTSSHTVAGYGAISAVLLPITSKEIVTVVKAYSSAVGAGPFVSEMFGEQADELRRRGGDNGEFGATTGRPRRMGWFDAVATRYGCRAQGATKVALTVLDALGYLDELKICVGYEINGEVTKGIPRKCSAKLQKPVYITLPVGKPTFAESKFRRSSRKLQELCSHHREGNRRSHRRCHKRSQARGIHFKIRALCFFAGKKFSFLLFSKKILKTS